MTYTDNMGITINDDDILNMPENLRVKLFDYLKEQRNLNHNRQQSFDHQNQCKPRHTNSSQCKTDASQRSAMRNQCNANAS